MIANAAVGKGVPYKSNCITPVSSELRKVNGRRQLGYYSTVREIVRVLNIQQSLRKIITDKIVKLYKMETYFLLLVCVVVITVCSGEWKIYA